jgi:signal transduction histidine kinase
LQKIVDNLLDLSKIESEQLELHPAPIALLNLLEEIQSAYENIAADKNIGFNLTIDYPIPRTIISDDVRLRQILFNLCSNAIKFTRQGGVNVSCSYALEEKKLYFKISDSGSGITEDQASKIFSPFSERGSSSTENYRGTSLSLTISKQLALMLNGDIELQSQPGQGSTFVFVLNNIVAPENDLQQQGTDFGKPASR